MNQIRHLRLLALGLLVLLATGCSVKRFAVNKLGNALAESGTTYSADNDPELVEGGQLLALFVDPRIGDDRRGRHEGKHDDKHRDDDEDND